MSEYVPQVGDRVTLPHWRNAHMTVVYVGPEYVIGILPNSSEKVGYRTEAWTKLPTFPERWINVYDNYVDDENMTRSAADQYGQSAGNRLGVIHLHPDGTLTMEQP